MSYVEKLEELCNIHRRETGETIQNLQRKCSLVVSTDGAIGLLRELTFKTHPKVEFSDDEDVLFEYNGIPVQLRHRSPPNAVIIARRNEVPRQKCCDRTALQTIMILLARGGA